MTNATTSTETTADLPTIQSIWDQELLTNAEVCRVMRIDRVTLRQLEKAGRFPKALRHMGKRIFWRTSDVREFLDDPEGWQARNAAKLEASIA